MMINFKEEIRRKCWHRIYRDKDLGGLTVGCLGSGKYILNDEMEAITEGYHEFSMFEGTLMGQTGSMLQKVVIL